MQTWTPAYAGVTKKRAVIPSEDGIHARSLPFRHSVGGRNPVPPPPPLSFRRRTESRLVPAKTGIQVCPLLSFQRKLESRLLETPKLNLNNFIIYFASKISILFIIISFSNFRFLFASLNSSICPCCSFIASTKTDVIFE